MSSEALKWTWWIIQGDPPLTTKSIAVLHTLAHRHNASNGRCDPSISCLARDTKLKDRAIQYAIKELEDAKIIKAVPRKLKGKKKNISNLYIFLDVKMGAPHAPSNGCTSCTTWVHVMHPKHGNIRKPRKPCEPRDLAFVEEGE